MKFVYFLALLCLLLTLDLRGQHHSDRGSSPKAAAVGPGLGNPRILQASYGQWAATYRRRGGERELVLQLGYSKALSSSFTRARGQAKFDLRKGSVSVTVSGLPEGEVFDVWLIDNRPGAGRSVKPEPGDLLVRLGQLRHGRNAEALDISLTGIPYADFEIDLVSVSHAGRGPGEGGLLFGAPSLFQKIFHERAEDGWALLGDTVLSKDVDLAASFPLDGAVTLVAARPAYAADARGRAAMSDLVAQGEDLFVRETFEGNGRTCASCHRPENNFTIDPKFIATLPDDDPLFVAEFNSDLEQNFENPRLMREFGLIVENQDGFADLANDFNLRGVPHTLALRTSVESIGGPRTGWSGDVGTLRDFATGAVKQHFTLTLNRVAGVDFRLPTDAELDAMEAFQLSLGRQEDLDLPLPLKGTVALRGQEIFLDDSLGKCNFCHGNAGANADFGGGNLGNVSFDTGVESLPDQPADLTTETVPPDDGSGTPGDGTFNTPTVVEAADTGPFFHNNSVETIEGAVAFYNGEAFNNSPSGQLLASRDPNGVGIQLDATQVVAVAAFLRVINAIENIRATIDLEDRILVPRHFKHSEELLELAAAENADAAEVLSSGGLHPEAAVRLEKAGQLLEKAIRKRGNDRRRLVLHAMALQDEARARLVEDEMAIHEDARERSIEDD